MAYYSPRSGRTYIVVGKNPLTLQIRNIGGKDAEEMKGKKLTWKEFGYADNEFPAYLQEKD